MKLSEIYLKAAERVEQVGDMKYFFMAIGYASLGADDETKDAAHDIAEAYFPPEEDADQHMPSQSMDERILALCFLAALCGDETRRRSQAHG